MTAGFPPLAATDAATLNRYSRVAGVAMLLSVIFGFLGEMYIPGLIISRTDPAATAAGILANPTLFRLGWAAYYVEGICDIVLAVLFYILLKPVNRNVALFSVFFGIASMVTFAISEATYFGASIILRDTGGMTAFPVEQRNALAQLATRMSAVIATLFIGLYGIASMIRGYLMVRSGYFPKWLGALLIIGGAGFFLRNITYLVAPSLSTQFFLLPMAAAGIPLTIWLLARGVRIQAA